MTLGKPQLLLGSIGILPKCVWMAREMENDGISHMHAHFANHPAVAAFAVHRLTGIPYSFTAHVSDLHVGSPDAARKGRIGGVCRGDLQLQQIDDRRGVPGQTRREGARRPQRGVDPEWFGERVRLLVAHDSSSSVSRRSSQ
jgi:hypothetical protein